MRTPHSVFVSDMPLEGASHEPPGYELAKYLADELSKNAVRVSEPDNWRDAGWALRVQSGDIEFEIYFAPYDLEAKRWLLGVATLGLPGFVRRLFGGKTPQYFPELKRTCGGIHAVLRDFHSASEIQWCLGGPPEQLEKFETPASLLWE